MYEYTSRRCNKCMLQEDATHGLTLDENGLCPLCRNHKPVERDWDGLRAEFAQRVDALKTGDRYEALVMMSGGKDSAFLAHLLKKEMGLNVLGLTLDNGFEYADTFKNAADIARRLDMPHMLFRARPQERNALYRFLVTSPGLMDKGFGQICLYCGKYLLDTAVEIALGLEIPAVFVGYNPEQLSGMGKTKAIETDELRIRQQEAIQGRIGYLFNQAEKKAAEHPDSHLLPEFSADTAPGCSIEYPFLYLPYQPRHIMEVARRELDWKPITSFVPKHYIASGCRLLKLMAALARINNVSSYMDHEFSAQVRAGDLDKDALEKYYANLEEPPQFYEELLQELGIEDSLEELARQVR